MSNTKIGPTGITFPDGTVQSTKATGSVSSIATGNGLSGGPISTTGTLAIAAPAALSIGSYAFVSFNTSGLAGVSTGGTLGGSNTTTPRNISFGTGGSLGSNLTGSWMWLGPNAIANVTDNVSGLAVRVS